MQFDDQDISIVALCVWKESRGDGQLGMKAVLDVIYNRARDWNKTLHEIVYAKNQFTSMSVPSDPEFNFEPQPGDMAYQFAQGITRSMLESGMGDITNGAHYYDNPKTATSGWFVDNIVKDTVNHPFTVTIGKQNFYK
jgi:spore germination cell wall hydrolase CwlJ-like protein